MILMRSSWGYTMDQMWSE